MKGEGPHKPGVEETAETNAESFLPPVKRNRKAALDLTEEERQAAFEETAEKLLDKLAQRELQ